MIFSNHEDIFKRHYRSNKSDLSSWCFTSFLDSQQKHLLSVRTRKKRQKISIKLQLEKIKINKKDIPQNSNTKIDDSFKIFSKVQKPQISPKISFTYGGSIDNFNHLFQSQQHNFIHNTNGSQFIKKGNCQKQQQQQKLFQRPSQSTFNYTNVELINEKRSTLLTSYDIQVNPSQTLSITSIEAKLQSCESKAKNIQKMKEIAIQQTQTLKKIQAAPFGRESSTEIKKKFQRGTLFRAVRRSQTLKNDYQSSSSHSQVIEDYKSLMSKIQQHRRQDSQEFDEI